MRPVTWVMILLASIFAGILIASVITIGGYFIEPQGGGWLLPVYVGMASAVLLAVAITGAIETYVPKHKMRDIEHPIVTGRSGRPEITDPLPGPARVRTPASGTHVKRESKKKGQGPSQ